MGIDFSVLLVHDSFTQQFNKNCPSGAALNDSRDGCPQARFRTFGREPHERAYKAVVDAVNSRPIEAEAGL